MKRILALVLLAPVAAFAAPFEISDDYLSTMVQPDHFVVRCSSTTTQVPVAKDAANGNLLYFRYDIAGMTAAQVAACNVTAANSIGQESTSVPFAPLPGIPGAPAGMRVTAQ